MKVPPSLLQVIAAAVLVSSIQSCANTERVKPSKQEKTTINPEKPTPTTPTPPYDCPSCGMG